ncbi:hypothetical protein KR032_007802 [Drosophila birchii]|nr:hypothetical protein KR032_007802 [Drosophila birchii]
MPTVRKMWYLKTTVTGEAERLIRHIDLKKENYMSAWEILVDAYNNPRHVADTILNRLDDPKSLKELYITTIESLASLKGLGIDISSWDRIIIATTKQKLDLANRALYEQSLDGSRELQGLDTMLNFLDQRSRRNRWMFATRNLIELQAVCKGIASTVQLNGTGLLSLAPGCTARNSKISVSTFSTVVSETKATYVRFGNISKIDCKDPPEPPQGTAAKEVSLEELGALKRQLVKLKETTWKYQLVAPQHHQVAAYVALAMSVLLGIVWALSRTVGKWTPRRRIFLRRTPEPKQSTEQSAPEPTPRSFSFDLSEG